MAFVKQFLAKTRPSDNTSLFRYSPVLPSGQLEIYALVSISNDVEAETSRFNKFVWDGFLDGFLSKDENIISRLKNALVGSEFKLKELIRHDKLLKEKGVDLNLSVLMFKENKVFVGILGTHKIFLYKKNMIDISDLLIKNKSDVGSMMIFPSDIFVSCYFKKDVSGEMKELHDVHSLENYLSKLFEKEDAFGGAFVATLVEEKKAFEKVEPVVTIEEGVKQEEEEIIEEIEVKKEDEKGGKFREIALLIFGKMGMGFEKLVSFLSAKLSRFFEKIKFALQNKYGRKRWFKKLQSTTSVKRFAHGIRPFKVDGYKDKELRMRRFVILLVFLFVICSVFLGVRSAYEARQRSVLASELNVLMEDWDGTVGEAERKALSDADESLKLLSEISTELDKYLDGLKEEGKFAKLGDDNNEKIAELQKKLSRVEDKANRIISLSEEDGNIQVFLDTKLSCGEKSDPVNFVISKGSQIVTGEVLYLIDKGEQAVYEITLSDGDCRKVADPSGLLKNPLHIDLGNNRDNEGLYVYDAESGVLRAGKDSEGRFANFKNLSGLTPKALGGDGVTGFAVFGLMDSLNFLVPSESSIFSAISIGGTTYSFPSLYISHPSFEQGTDLFGDQYVYVLSKTPDGIKRFVPQTGQNRQLTVMGLKEDLKGITAGYTGPTMDKILVVFDSEINKFVQFSKPIEVGEHQVHPGEIVLMSQYEYRGNREDIFNDVKSLVLTDDEKFMYVLDGKIIWKINIEKD